MGVVPMAGVVGRAEQEIAIVVERVDVLRAAALERAAAWDGRNSRPCRAAGTRSAPAPRSRRRRCRKIATGAPLRSKKPGSPLRRRGGARTATARKKPRTTTSGPRKIAVSGEGVAHRVIARLAQHDARPPARNATAMSRRAPGRCAPRSRPSDIVSAWPSAARSATWVRWPSNAVADDFGVQGGDAPGAAGRSASGRMNRVAAAPGASPPPSRPCNAPSGVSISRAARRAR